MARLYIRPQSPRGVTLAVAVVLWLIGALEMLAVWSFRSTSAGLRCCCAAPC
jgi:hypothetical protein